LHWRIGRAHLRQHRFGRDAAIHQPDATRLAVQPLDVAQEVAQGSTVVGVAGENFIRHRQTVGRHDESDHHLRAIRPVIARITEAAFVAFRERRVGFEVGTGQIVEQHVEVGVEQIPPTLSQMPEQRVLMSEQPIMAGIELVDLREIGIGAQKITQCGAGEPLSIQSPLAAGRDQPVRGQYEQHVIPARAFTAGRQTRQPELIEVQFFPQMQGQPARTPLARPAQAEFGQPQTDDRVIRQQAFRAIVGEQR
jgi:hypothetical protein